MKIILLKDVERVGKSGQIINTSDGFARNFLISKNLAMPATVAALNAVKLRQVVLDKKQAKEKDKFQQLAQKISGMSATVTAAAGEEDKLYGSVTSQDIADVLKQENIEVDKKDIIIESPINKLGVYQIKVKLHPEVEASLRIWVVKK